MVFLVPSTHIKQVTQNVTSIANFNLILDIEIAHSACLEASYTRTAEAGVWRNGGEQGQALSITKVSKSLLIKHLYWCFLGC